MICSKKLTKSNNNADESEDPPSFAPCLHIVVLCYRLRVKYWKEKKWKSGYIYSRLIFFCLDILQEAEQQVRKISSSFLQYFELLLVL